MNIKIEISVRRVAKGKLKKARFYADFRVSQSPKVYRKLKGEHMKADACFRFLGKYINFSISKKEKFGRIVQIRIDSNERMLVGIEENGFIEEYDLNQVNIIKNNKEQKNLTKQIIKQINKDINSFKYDLGEYRKKELIQILQKISNEEVRDKIIDCLGSQSIPDLHDYIYEEIRHQEILSEEMDLLCGIIAYKQHDQDTAYKVFSRRWIANKNDADCCRDFILIADEFDNDALCFYLIKHFFKINCRYINDKYYIDLWWKYLYYAVKYNNFDLIEKMVVNEWNVRVLIDSYIYIFYMYNLEHLAVDLTNQFINGNNTILQRNNEDLGNIEEAIEELNICKNYIPDTAEGYYLRFEFCMKCILSVYEKGNYIPDTEERDGYIYEYVKSRNYGFIIGYDFQKYFYHWEYLSQNLRKQVMDNIYSSKKIENEDKIYVQFRYECNNKKIQAMDII